MTFRVESMVARASSSFLRLACLSSDSSLRISGTRALRLAGLGLLAMSLSAGVRLAAQAEHVSNATRLRVSSRGLQTVQLDYTGTAQAVNALTSGGATATALAAADFNADGAVDVVAGYSTKEGGVLTLLLGNQDAFAPADHTLYEKAMKGNVPPTFQTKAPAYALPEAPELLATGDFNRDGKEDVLVAARGGRLYLLAGDGKGGLLAPQMVSLSGSVRALAATGDGHVAVSLDGESGQELRILAPGPEGLMAGASYPLPARGDSVAWGTLGGGADVAVGAGSHIEIVYGALTSKPQTETVDLSFKVAALELGNFIWDRDGRLEISVLAADGSISILQHGTLDTRPITAADVPGRRKAMMEKGKQPLDPTSLGHWSVAKKLPYAGAAQPLPVSHSAFNSPRLAASESEDLMVLDGQRNQLSILDTSGKTAQPRADITFSGAPMAALALQGKIDSSRDTVVLVAGRSKPILFTSDADPTFNVTTTTDEDTNNACTNTSVTSGNGTDGKLSLREALCEVNNSPAGTYTVNVPAGTYQLTGIETGEIYVGMTSGQTISIVGAGASTTIIEQTDGKDRIFEVDPNINGNVPVTISNITLSGGNCSSDDGTQTPPADCSLGGGAVLSGGIGGDSLAITDAVFSNNSDPDIAGGGNTGGAIVLGGPGMSITSSTFTSNNVPQGQGGAIWFGNEGATAEGNLTVTNSTFTNNSVTSASFSEGGAIFATPAAGFSVIVTGSTFTGNKAPGTGGESGNGGAIDVTGSATVSNSRFSGNTAAAGGGFYEFNGTATVTDNWWGCNGGPGATGCDTVGSANSSTVTDSPWLVMTFSASPTQIGVGNTSTLTASIDTDSNGATGLSVPDGTPATFSGGTLGTASPSPSNFSGGTAISTFTAGSSSGTATVSATVDNQTLTTNIGIAGPPVLTVSKSHTGNFTQGSTAAVWSLQVSNVAAAAADATTTAQVTLVDTVPTGYTPVGATGTGWGCTRAGNIVTCHISKVVAGAGGLFPILKLTFDVPANSPTSVTNNVVVYGGGSTTQTGTGNGATASDTATVVQVPASVTISNGGGTQSAAIGTGFGTPLSVTVTDAGSVVIPGYSVIFTANAGGSGQSGTFSNSTGTITVPTNGSGVANAGTFTANLKTGAYTVTAAAGSVSNTFNLTNLDKSATTIASLTASTATIDVFGFGFTAPSGQLAFTDVTSSNPVAGPVTLNTATATAAVTPQVTTSTGANTLPDWTTLGDINGDGKLDLVTSLYSTNSVSVQLGNGDGTFQTATIILIAADFGPAESHLVSLRGNGTLDLIVGSFNLNQIAVLLGNGNGTFQSPAFYTIGSGNNATSLTTGDFNHDGDLDVAVANTSENTVSILLGNGAGALTLQSPAISVGREPEAVRAGDFNGDGYSDLAVANYRDGTVTTLLNNQNGTYTATTISVGNGAGSGPQALATAGSGSSLLLAVANYLNNTVSVLKSNGNGTFGAQTIVSVGKGPDDLSFADLNGDGVEDLVVANYTDGSVDLLLGSSGGSYTLAGPFKVGNNPYSAAVGDLNGDGTPDLVVSNCFSNNIGALLDGTQIAVSYTGLSLTTGDTLHAVYSPDGSSKYGSSTSANVTAP